MNTLTNVHPFDLVAVQTATTFADYIRLRSIFTRSDRGTSLLHEVVHGGMSTREAVDAMRSHICERCSEIVPMNCVCLNNATITRDRERAAKRERSYAATCGSPYPYTLNCGVEAGHDAYHCFIRNSRNRLLSSVTPASARRFMRLCALRMLEGIAESDVAAVEAGEEPEKFSVTLAADGLSVVYIRHADDYNSEYLREYYAN